jgi:hypothetical protein
VCPADIEGHSEAAKFGQPGRLSAGLNVRSGPESCRDIRSPPRQLRARSGIQLYPQSSDGKSSHYEATGDYHNSRCVYYKEKPKPAIYGVR